MATVTLATLRSRAKSLCDKANDGFVTDSEWNQWINEGADEVHAMLATAGIPYTESTTSSTTSGTEDLALSPSTVLFVTGLELQINGQWKAVKPFHWEERAALRNITDTSGRSTRYCVRGGNLKLLPAPVSGLNYKLSYVPVRAQLVSDSETLDAYNSWQQYACVYAAIRALQKGEEDATHLERELARQADRVRTEASHRDMGAPKAVRDAYADEDGDAWSFDWRLR
jgi:hypothetical protein